MVFSSFMIHIEIRLFLSKLYIVSIEQVTIQFAIETEKTVRDCFLQKNKKYLKKFLPVIKE